MPVSRSRIRLPNGSGRARKVRHQFSRSDIKATQQALGVKVDGQAGPETKAAIKNFQKQKGLAVDGVVGPQTSSALAD